MDSIKDILKRNRRLPPETNSSVPGVLPRDKEVQLPDLCICATVAGRKMGFVYPSFFRDGTPIPDSHPAFGKKVECACARAEVAHNLPGLLREMAQLPAGDFGFANYRIVHEGAQEAMEAVRAWATGQLDVPWVFLYGTVGTGKSHLAAAAGHALIGQGVHARYQVVTEMLNELRSAISADRVIEHSPDAWSLPSRYHERREYLLNVQALLLDDLGVSRSTGFAEEQMYEIIGHRYVKRLPLLVTTNALPEQLDERIVSRLRDVRMCRQVPMVWDDYRPKRLANA